MTGGAPTLPRCSLRGSRSSATVYKYFPSDSCHLVCCTQSRRGMVTAEHPLLLWKSNGCFSPRHCTGLPQAASTGLGGSPGRTWTCSVTLGPTLFPPEPLPGTKEL